MCFFKSLCGGSVLFFCSSHLVLQFCRDLELDVTMARFLGFWRVRLPFGCGVTAVVLVHLVLLSAGFCTVAHTNVCTQMNENILLEYLIMVSQGMDWRSIVLRTNELAKIRKCHFYHIFYSSEQCCLYFTRCIVKHVEKDQHNISVCDGKYASVDRHLALNAVHTFKRSQELTQLQ